MKSFQRPHIDLKVLWGVNKLLTRPLVSAAMFTSAERSTAELAFVFLLGRTRRLLGRCRRSRRSSSYGGHRDELPTI